MAEALEGAGLLTPGILGVITEKALAATDDLKFAFEAVAEADQFGLGIPWKWSWTVGPNVAVTFAPV